jgi:photosystem II stability/assembly factor-like uncharacterized protein
MKQSVRALAVSLAVPVALVATGSTAATPAVPQVELLAAVSPHRHIYAADMDGDYGFAVGALGTVLETRDGGLSWSDTSLQEPLALLAVALAGERAVAVGQLGLVAVRNGGRWVATQAPTEERLLGVDLNTRGLGIAVGAFGTVLRTEDGGFSWRVVDIDWEKFFPSGEEPHVYDVHIDEHGRVTLVGEFGMVLRSDEGGHGWRLLRSGDASLFALKVDGSIAFAVGQDGTVLRSLDEGASWKELDTGVSANLLAAARSPAQRQLLVPGMRSVLYSGDSGDSWHELIHGDFSRGWYGDVIWSERLGAFLLFGHGGQIKSIKSIKGVN